MAQDAFEIAHQTVCKLVDDFTAYEHEYHSSTYSEAAVRQDFIDKFWAALGWDIYHERQKNPFEQEVKIERAVQSGAGRRRADYAFYAAPNFRDVKFYVEAKKPSSGIESQDHYFQAIRYGWNSQTPLVVLNDFEQFHVVDCRRKPDIETALSRLVLKYNYRQYKEREIFSWIYFLFGRDATANGAIEKFVENLPKGRGKAIQRGLFKGGYQSIDEFFLEELDEYRGTLARSFNRTNPDLDGEALTEATQRTLDRLVFLRFLEDKLIESERQVEKFGDKVGVWKDFIATCERLNRVYNGIVFKKHGVIDDPAFVVDDSDFGDICERLSSINSPYDFDKIPIHILGSIYERFLGKIIVISNKGAELEEKPLVRKAGGVYYTPEFIVSYIVENTVGKLIENKAPKEIAAMRFADIACGSGSFLLAVYDLLLRWHANYYNDNPSRMKKGDMIERNGMRHLSLSKRREILLNNIYGVDIDAQAVEVAQLSLYLKLLEEETTASAQHYQTEFHITLLPPLNENIVCGNSLIGTDILEEQFEFNAQEEKKLNPMDFAQRFPEIMRNGGFDAIVGNPPYIRIQVLQEFNPLAVDYLKKKYKAASKGNYDVYVTFIERALSFLKASGKLGYIVPHKFFNAKYGESIRKLISTGRHLSHILHFGDQQVFAGATTYTCICIFTKNQNSKCEVTKVKNLSEWRSSKVSEQGIIPSEKITESEWNFNVGSSSYLINKLRANKTKLEDIGEIFVGLQTSADKVFILDFVNKTAKKIVLRSKSLNKEIEFSQNLIFPLVSGVDVKRYGTLPSRQFILFPYQVDNKQATLLELDEIASKNREFQEYLSQNKKVLSEREGGKFKDNNWYRFGRSQNLGIQNQTKICVPRLVHKLHAAYDLEGSHFLDNVDVSGMVFKDKYKRYDLLYLLALLNSKLLAWYFPSVSAPFRGGFISANRQFLGQLPIILPDLNKDLENKTYCKIINLAEQRNKITPSLEIAITDKDRTFYEQKCASLDLQIDNLVYKLYGLTEDEMKAVEESAI